MVVYGFLSYENGKVRIPNSTNGKVWWDAAKEKSLGYIYRLAKESDKMLQATLANDIKQWKNLIVCSRHRNTDLSYNHETELSAIVNLPTYQQEISIVLKEKIKLEKVCGFYFYPYDRAADRVILELKVDKHQNMQSVRLKKNNMR